MITVFGHLEEAVVTGCVEVIFNGGPNGGSVTFFRCGLTRSTTINLFPGEESLAFCVENNSWIFGFGDFCVFCIFCCGRTHKVQ